MSDFIIQAVIVACWCWGFYNAFQEKQVFGMAGEFLRAKISEFWLKPIIGCPVCMPSIHGTIWFLILNEWDFFFWILFIVSTSGLNFVIKEHLYNEEED